MMIGYGMAMSGGMMLGMGLFGLLVLTFLVLGIAALGKYLFVGNHHRRITPQSLRSDDNSAPPSAQ
jgi:hypothetical protein